MTGVANTGEIAAQSKEQSERSAAPVDWGNADPPATADALVEPYVRFEYQAETQEELSCPICTEPAVEALKLCGDHLVCTKCVPVLGERRTCPVCNHELSTDAKGQLALAPASNLVKRMLGKLTVRCTAEECTWSGPRTNLRDHLLMSCERIACSHEKDGCDFRGRGFSVAKHLAEDCPYQMVPCPAQELGCDAIVPRRRVEEHRRAANECAALQQSLERKRAACQERSRAEAAAAVSRIVNVKPVLFKVEGRTFSISRQLLLGPRCAASVLEVVAGDEKMREEEICLDCGTWEMEKVVGWVRYGAVPDQATMTDCEWQALLGFAEALHLEGFLAELRKPSRRAVMSLMVARGGKVQFFGCDLSGFDFSDRDLSYSDFTGADLTRTKFSSARLKGANFSNANLTNADMYRAVLDGADFTNANMTGASLSASSGSGADFRGADLSSTRFTNAKLEFANFTNADLTSASFGKERIEFSSACLAGANLSGQRLNAGLYSADLSGAKLTSADLSGCGLSEANLAKASLVEAKLSEAMFRSADLREADLTKADLESAYLNGADLRRADLTSANLRSAKVDDNTRKDGAILEGACLPKGFY